MKIIVNTNNGVILDTYSKHAPDTYKYKGNPTHSFPIEILDTPIKTKTFAITLIDHDAIPVCGFSWIHWSCCNIRSDLSSIPAGFGTGENNDSIHGKNSFCSPFLGEVDDNLTTRYIGPTPPDKDHRYELTIYALDSELDLKNGYYLNELLYCIDSHLLNKTSITLMGRN